MSQKKGAVKGVPENSQDGGGIPAPEEEPHLRRRVGAISTENGGVENEPDCAEGEKSCDGAVAEIAHDQKKFNEKKRSDEEFSADSPDLCSESAAAGFFVGLDVHNFAEDVRVHGEERAEEKSLPRKLWGIVDPAAQDEDQQVASLNEDVERWTAFESDGASVVDVDG